MRRSSLWMGTNCQHLGRSFGIRRCIARIREVRMSSAQPIATRRGCNLVSAATAAGIATISRKPASTMSQWDLAIAVRNAWRRIVRDASARAAAKPAKRQGRIAVTAGIPKLGAGGELQAPTSRALHLGNRVAIQRNRARAFALHPGVAAQVHRAGPGRDPLRLSIKVRCRAPRTVRSRSTWSSTGYRPSGSGAISI